jgi:hypothetical protein
VTSILATITLYCYIGLANGLSNGLTDDGKIAVASTLTFVAGSSIFFIIGFLCGHFCRKERCNTTSQSSAGPGTAGQCDQENIPSTPIYEDVVLKQREQELGLKENVAYAPVI